MNHKEFINEFENLNKFFEQFSKENDINLDLEDLEKSMSGMLDGKVTLEYVSEGDETLKYNYITDSGFDLTSKEEITLKPLGRALVPTGIFFNLPEDYEIQVRSKSGLAINQGLMVLNSPGTVDEGYTGEIKVIIFNTNNHEFVIKKGMKVAQAVLSRCVSGKWVNLKKVDKIEDKDRGNKGFGSTGI